MKDFPFWRGAIYNAKTPVILKSVGEDLANFQKQTGLFGDGEKKLTDEQVATLRLEYSTRMKKLEKEALPPQTPGKPKFNK
jgi:hypothetical protein